MNNQSDGSIITRWIIGGCVGMIVGGLLWALAVYLLDRELRWMSILLGATTGFGVSLAGYQTLDKYSGVIAATLAIAGFIIGRMILFQLYISTEIVLYEPDPSEVDTYVAVLADNVLTDLQKEYVDDPEAYYDDPRVRFRPRSKGRDDFGDAMIEMTAGELDYDYSLNYHPEVWKEASQRWAKLTEAEQQAIIDEQRLTLEVSDEMAELLEEEGGAASMVTMNDGLWIALAMAAAFHLGANGLKGLQLVVPGFTIVGKTRRPLKDGEAWCENCDEIVPVDAPRCFSCGASRVTTRRVERDGGSSPPPPAPVEAARRCEHCGETVGEDSRRCLSCGRSLVATTRVQR